jgi:hypothetical protein
LQDSTKLIQRPRLLLELPVVSPQPIVDLLNLHGGEVPEECL